jgi:hypothetical protein
VNSRVNTTLPRQKDDETQAVLFFPLASTAKRKIADLV